MGRRRVRRTPASGVARHRRRRALPRRSREHAARSQVGAGPADRQAGAAQRDRCDLRDRRRAACVATCADRARAGVGPDVWLVAGRCSRRSRSAGCARSSTPARASPPAKATAARRSRMSASSRATRTAGLGRCAARRIRRRPTDRTPGGSECEFQNAFAGFPEPLGNGLPQGSVSPLQPLEVRSERSSRTVRHLLRLPLGGQRRGRARDHARHLRLGPGMDERAVAG